MTGKVSQPFGGQIQHTRPAVDACVPVPIAPVAFDANLKGPFDPTTGLHPSGFRRSVGERAGPPYIGRGLMEAVPTQDITANADPSVENGDSSLGNFASELQCPSTGCISGKANMIPRTFAVNPNGTVTGFVGGVGRFGLRANGVEMLQFVVGGLQGELSFTSLLNPAEINFPTLFPGGTTEAMEPAACAAARSETPGQPVNLATLEVHLSTPFSIRNLLRNTAPPEFGDTLIDLLQSPDPTKPRHGESGSKGPARSGTLRHRLEGVRQPHDPGPHAGRGRRARSERDQSSRSQAELRRLPYADPTDGAVAGRCGGGASQLCVGADLLGPAAPQDAGHQCGAVLRRDRGIRWSSRAVQATGERIFNTFDLPRNLADDTFNNQKASADGREFRTAPLMGLGRIGPPFLHDGRVYLSELTVGSTPAGTVTTNRGVTNAPLVVRSVGGCPPRRHRAP